jgi:glycosyltransferase involved in cell wall biosynthesis
MRIGFDLTGLWRPATGVYVYAIELARNLLNINCEHEYTFFFTREVHPEFDGLDKKFKAVLVPFRDEIVSKQLAMGVLCNTLDLDLIHFPTFPPPLTCFRPTVWTIHDATPWIHPKTMSLKGKLYFGSLGSLTARMSRAIITVSNESKRNIVQSLHISEQKVRVIYEGVSKVFRRVEDASVLKSIRQRYGLPDQFLLTVGTLEPRKNLPFLIKVFFRLREILPRLGLVVVGRKGWKTGSIDKLLAETGNDVVVTGFVPRSDLVGLYSLASAFVQASVYEGFGFPPLEAMACGCPVVVSNRGSLPEVAGGAGLLLELDNVDLWVKSLHSLLGNPSVAQALVGKGLLHAKKFCWRSAAKDTLDLYSRVAARDDLFAHDRAIATSSTDSG